MVSGAMASSGMNIIENESRQWCVYVCGVKEGGRGLRQKRRERERACVFVCMCVCVCV